MQGARIEAQLDVSLAAMNSCSIAWLIPDSNTEIPATMQNVVEICGGSLFGFAGFWAGSKKYEAVLEQGSQFSRMNAQYGIGETRMKAEMYDLPPVRSQWFWDVALSQIRPYQVCAALIPKDSLDANGWRYAGVQMVLAAASLQARPGGSYQYTLRALRQAFLAEVVSVGGIALTRLGAELLPQGVALTSSPQIIDNLSGLLAEFESVEPLLVERSRYLSGDW